VSITELNPNGQASTGDRARQVWRPGMKGAELARQLDVPDRTGRFWASRLEAEAADGKPAPPPAATPDRQVRRKPAARGKAAPTPIALLVATNLAVAVVAAVALVVSYTHIRHLAIAAGMGSLAGWLPLALDGLVVACSCSLIVDRRHGKPVSPLAAGGLALGLAASLAANVLAVDPALVSERVVRIVLAGYSPLALAVSAHLLLRMLGERQ
jgi:Protein of unknown function (DUF2637)